jgi:thermitase
MLSPRSLVTFGQLTLLTLALASCGGQVAPSVQAPQAAATPASASQPAQSVAGQIVTVSVRPGTTDADLLSRYPGVRILALHADEGYAQLYTVDALPSKPAMGTLSLNAQAVAVVATEPDLTLNSSVTPIDENADAQGTSAWAGGTSAWAGGTSAWAGGSVNDNGGTNAFAENKGAWTKLDLAGGQKLAPLLGQGVRVAVLDTGVDISHPALAGHLDVGSGWDFIGNDGTPQDDKSPSGSNNAYGHGTAVSSIILQIAPNAIIMPYRVLAASGEGKTSGIIKAVNEAVIHKAKVINMSLGMTTPSIALDKAIASAIRSGAMVVASSGNSGDDGITFPARNSLNMQADLTLGGGLLSVGSVSSDDKKSSFSTFGPGIDVVAPGEKVVSAFPGGLRATATGTSFAAPQVSGAVALAMSAGRTDVIALYKSIKLSATAATDLNFTGKMGKGTLNVARLMVTK